MATTPQQIGEEFRRNGYAIPRGLFSPDETNLLATYFKDMVERGEDGWSETPGCKG